MTVNIKWATPEADAMIGYCARVSNPANQDNPDVAKLLTYCARNNHWSVFEMASACIEINTTRDIARQILRHRSFSFQEFSQRYADVGLLGHMVQRECRLQDTKNRQNSIELQEHEKDGLQRWWSTTQELVYTSASMAYESALKAGIAKEQARALLPEGLTPSRMYVNGTLRSWITYLQARLDQSTQKEHRIIAKQVLDELVKVAPITMSAFFPEVQYEKE